MLGAARLVNSDFNPNAENDFESDQKVEAKISRTILPVLKCWSSIIAAARW